MATFTENFNLTKPDRTDNIDITVLNENFDKIDQNLKRAYVVTFTENEDGSWSADKSYAEVYAAAEKGFKVVAVGIGEYANFSADLAYISEKGLMFTAIFPTLNLGNLTDTYSFQLHLYMLGSDDSVSVSTDTFQALSSVTVKENWTFTLEDGSTVTKAVYVG